MPLIEIGQSVISWMSGRAMTSWMTSMRYPTLRVAQ